ncbi:hypothetical protein BDV59DRAFT_96563 [Aspergillus ambiguus]|uniref:uncharacterized protein n=1 Tax=Aspergillus ambiguus TaxID=176160 RepID=UPI003CCC9C91
MVGLLTRELGRPVGFWSRYFPLSWCAFCMVRSLSIVPVESSLRWLHLLHLLLACVHSSMLARIVSPYMGSVSALLQGRVFRCLFVSLFGSGCAFGRSMRLLFIPQWVRGTKRLILRM